MDNRYTKVSCENCGNQFLAKKADRTRRWAKCCSKSCAATLREKPKRAARAASAGVGLGGLLGAGFGGALCDTNATTGATLPPYQLQQENIQRAEKERLKVDIYSVTSLLQRILELQRNS